MPPKGFAEGTKVEAEDSERELRKLLKSSNCDHFLIGHYDGAIMVAFRHKDPRSGDERHIRFRTPMPDRQSRRITHTPKTDVLRSPASQENALAAEERRVWRALVLTIKAKLVSVAEGIETVEQAFLAQILMPDGATVYDHVQEPLRLAYDTGDAPPLLPPPGRPA